MNESASSAAARPARRRWSLVVTLAFLAGAVVLWLVAGHVFPANNDRIFRGRPETVWIKELKYSDDEQVNQWRAYGEVGVQVLIRGLERANHPGERAYRKLSRKLPGLVRGWLPSPKDDSTRSTRMCLVSLLSSLGNDAKSATPIMIQTVSSDEDDSVRQSAINFFTTSEDERCLLNQLPATEKNRLLPGLMRDLQNTQNWGLRNNAANALRWFPEQRAILAPVLVSTLQDPQVQVRLLAASALNRVDPDTAKRAGAASVVIAITKDPDDQVASRAASALRYFKTEPEPVVPVLIELLASTNTLVACEAVWVLEWSGKEFRSYVETIVPALTQAAQRKDNVAGYAKTALKRFQFAGDPTQAIK